MGPYLKIYENIRYNIINNNFGLANIELEKLLMLLNFRIYIIKLI